MAPQKWELADGIPFTGPSGKIFNESLLSSKIHRASVFVTNIVNFLVDDNNLYSVPQELMEAQRERVFRELEAVRPNVLLIMGADTLDLLTASSLFTNPKTKELDTNGSKNGIIKWRGSIFTITTPRGYVQKCVAAMHPASFIRGQWKWLPIFKYIDVPRVVTQSSSSELKIMSRTALIAPSFLQAKEYITEAMKQEYVSIDYEGRRHLSCLGLGWSASEAMCIPMSRVGSPSYWSLQEEISLWSLWCKLLQNPKVKKICQNASYEWIKSWQYGIYPNPLGIDTMHLHHCLYPDFGGISDEWEGKKRDIDNPGHGLAFITSQYTDQPYYKDDGRHWTPALGEHRFWQYNCLDVMVTFEAAQKMESEAVKAGLWEAYKREYLDYFETAMQQEWHGVLQDVEKRDAVRVDCKADLEFIGSKMKALTGYDRVIAKGIKGAKPQPGVLNLASPKQMRRFLYEERKYPKRINRKTMKVTTDKDTLHMYAIKYNDEGLRQIVKMREIQHFMSNVVDAKLDEHNRIHCHTKLGGTNGTRVSSAKSILESGTNLQNLPRQGPGRSFFLPG
jgi:uracil-DNA glycosylase family 4